MAARRFRLSPTLISERITKGGETLIAKLTAMGSEFPVGPLTSFPCEYITHDMHHWVTNDLFMRLRPGTPLHDDATPPDPSQPAPSLCHHGDEPDEPPQHHCEHGGSSTGAEPALQNGHLCYKGNF